MTKIFHGVYVGREREGSRRWKFTHVATGANLRMPKTMPLSHLLDWLTGRVPDPAGFIAEHCAELVAEATARALK
jgi:hypothetical protein